MRLERPLFVMSEQARGLIAGIIAATQADVRDVQRQLLQAAETEPVASPGDFADRLARVHAGAVAALWPKLSARLAEFIAAVNQAYPRFVGRAIPVPTARAERAVDLSPGLGGFDPGEVEEEDDSNLAMFLLLWLLLPQYDLMLLLLKYEMMGATLAVQWELFQRKQSLDFIQRLKATAALAANDLASDPSGSGTNPTRAIRDAVSEEIRRVIAGDGGTLRPRSLLASVNPWVLTATWGLFSAVQSAAVARNKRFFAGMMYSAVPELGRRLPCKCRDYDGQMFPLQPDGTIAGPMIPQHAFCMCQYVPVLLGERRG